MTVSFRELKWQSWQSGARASTPFGYYLVSIPHITGIEPEDDDGASYMTVPGRKAPQSAHDTPEEAKEAAQRDFDRRVSKCIFQTMKTAKGETVSREAVDAFMESIGSKTVDVGKCIKVMRAAAGMTQEQMASAIGATQGSLSKWESGEEMPGAAAFLKIQWVCTHGLEH